MLNRVIFFSVMLIVPALLFSMNNTPEKGSSEEVVQLLKSMSTSVQNVIDIFLKYGVSDPDYKELNNDYNLATKDCEHLVTKASSITAKLKKWLHLKKDYVRLNNVIIESNSFLINIPNLITCDNDNDSCIMNSKNDFKTRITLITSNVVQLQKLKNEIELSIAKIAKPLQLSDVPKLLREFIKECKRLKQLGVKAGELGNRPKEMKISLNKIIEEVTELLSSVTFTKVYMENNKPSFANISPRLEYAVSYLTRMKCVLERFETEKPHESAYNIALEKYLDLSSIYFDYGIISATSNSEDEKARLLFKESRVLCKVVMGYMGKGKIAVDFFKDNEFEKLKVRIQLLMNKGYIPKHNDTLNELIKKGSSPDNFSMESVINILEQYSLLREPEIVAGTDLDVENKRAFRFGDMSNIVNKRRERIIPCHGTLKNLVCYGLVDGGDGIAQRVTCTELPWSIAGKVKYHDNDKDLRILRNNKDVVGSILFNSFKDIDNEIKNRSDDGTSALCSVIIGDTLWIAHVGNNRALVCSENGTIAFETSDHKPSNKHEKMRLELEGGSTSILGGLKIFPDEDLDLDVSRALGYYCVDGDKPIGLIARPEIKRIKLTPDHRFIIIATQDYYKIMSNDTIAGMVRDAIKDNVKAGDIEKNIHKKAVKLGLQEDAPYPIVMIINWGKN